MSIAKVILSGLIISVFSLWATADNKLFMRGLAEYDQQSYEKALIYWKRSARKNNVAAVFNIALLYEKGLGVEQDLIEAEKWFKKAAKKKYPLAQYRLAQLLADREDYQQAMDLYLAAANQGHTTSQYYLAVMHLQGTAGQKDYTLAFSWMKKAAEAGDVDSQYLLGVLYERGYGTEIDVEQARYWLAKAVALGHEQAKAVLDKMNEKSDSKT